MALSSTDKHTVVEGLLAGYGTENIAVMFGFRWDEVQGFVSDLRSSGALSEIYRNDELEVGVK